MPSLRYTSLLRGFILMGFLCCALLLSVTPAISQDDDLFPGNEVEKNRLDYSNSLGSMGGKILNTKQILEIQSQDKPFTLILDRLNNDSRILKFLESQICLKRLSLKGSRFDISLITMLAKLSEKQKFMFMLANQGHELYPGLTQLESLNISDCTQVTDFFITEIVKLTELKSLYLNNCRISDAKLAELNSLTKLENISLMNTPASTATLKSLALLPNLKMLDIRRISLSTDALKELDNFKQIDTIKLICCHPVSKLSFLKSNHNLKDIFLEIQRGGSTFNSGFNDLIKILKENENLRALSFQYLTTSEDTFKNLKSLNQLTSLSLYNSQKFTPGMFDTIAQMPALRSLTLSGFVSNNIIKEIVVLKQIETLYIENSSLNDILCLKSLTNLKTITFKNCLQLKEENVEALRKEMPQCHIIFQ